MFDYKQRHISKEAKESHDLIFNGVYCFWYEGEKVLKETAQIWFNSHNTICMQCMACSSKGNN